MSVESILVTGGSGFVGSAIIRLLKKRYPQSKITYVDLKPSQRPIEADYVSADITNADATAGALLKVKPEIVVHTAGYVPRGTERYDKCNSGLRERCLGVNHLGTRNVLQAARRAGVKTFVYTSSCAAIVDDFDRDFPNYSEGVLDPTSLLVYGESKARAEKLVLEENSSKFTTCVLRPSTIFGPEDYQLIPTVHACIANGETPFVIGSNDNLFDFMYVDNIAHAHVLAVENLTTSKSAAGQAFNISNGQPITLRDFCLGVWAAFGHVPPYTVYIPARLAWFMGLVAEMISSVRGKPTAICRGSINDALGTKYANIQKARNVLGYKPLVDMWDGIRISAEAYKERLANSGRTTMLDYLPHTYQK